MPCTIYSEHDGRELVHVESELGTLSRGAPGMKRGVQPGVVLNECLYTSCHCVVL